MEEGDSIAIVGIGCRFPGADDIDEFWELLKNGEDHVKTIPKERWDIETIHIQKLDDDWKPEAMWAGLVKDHDKFDNKFFGISDSEAGWMDPHQCMALEVTYSALENAGLTREMLKGTNTGVYVGVMNRDLSLGLTDAAAEYNNFVVTGSASSIVSNLISYHFDIRGPSMTVDTACSSALVSIHLGCQAIKSGDCAMAICGGVNSILTPINNIVLSKAQMISKTGKSRAFSADADGYVRGEGCGMVVLKPLKKARADGNRIWGIVMSGCNQDGKASTPITAPSGQQQKTLLQNIYSHYNISPSTIQYIEAHGTGTPVGDPTEMNALAEFFKSKLEYNIKIPIGSVKTNIGHLESSAGTAGLIKVLLMMKYEKIVPSLHYSKGYFLQETTNGQDHMVDICVIETSSKTIILQWDTKEKEETVAMSSVMDTKSYFLNGMKVVMLQTHSRQYIFKTTDHGAFDVFMTFISLKNRRT